MEVTEDLGEEGSLEATEEIVKTTEEGETEIQAVFSLIGTMIVETAQTTIAEDFSTVVETTEALCKEMEAAAEVFSGTQIEATTTIAQVEMVFSTTMAGIMTEEAVEAFLEIMGITEEIRIPEASQEVDSSTVTITRAQIVEGMVTQVFSTIPIIRVQIEVEVVVDSSRIIPTTIVVEAGEEEAFSRTIPIAIIVEEVAEGFSLTIPTIIVVEGFSPITRIRVATIQEDFLAKTRELEIIWVETKVTTCPIRRCIQTLVNSHL
jgi:hypothetical protein